MYPPKAKNGNEVRMATGNWETSLREFASVGGTFSDEDRRKNAELMMKKLSAMMDLDLEDEEDDENQDGDE